MKNFAKSRLPHNKNKRRYKNALTGKYFYHEKDSGKNTLLILGSSVVCGFLLSVFGNARSVQAMDLINPYVEGELVVAQQALPTPTPTPIAYVSNKPHIEDYIRHTFGEDANKMITIINECENKGWNEKAVNHNRNGSIDVGIAQINSIHGRSVEDMGDYRKNIDEAYQIYKRAGNRFTPWSCAWVINEKPFYEL